MEKNLSSTSSIKIKRSLSRKKLHYQVTTTKQSASSNQTTTSLIPGYSTFENIQNRNSKISSIIFEDIQREQVEKKTIVFNLVFHYFMIEI